MSEPVAKRCPFCGNKPDGQYEHVSEPWVFCVTDGCPMSDEQLTFSLSVWNRRPIEDELIAEAEAGEEAYNTLLREQ